jgi:uncharacterized protein (DUF58 family)
MPFREAWLFIGPLLVLAGFGAGQPLITGVGFAVVLVGGVSRYWHRHLFDRVTLSRSLSERRAFVDDTVQLHVELENRKLLPLPWYEWRLAVAEHASVRDEHLSAAAAPGFSWLVRRGAIGWYERQEWTFSLSVSERGYHQFGPASLRSADLLGLFPDFVEDDRNDRLIVFPRVYSMEDLGFPADRPFGELKGRNRIFEDPRRIAGVREYRYGDPLRRIDWKATARAGELRSRIYEPSASRQFYILLNIDTLSHSWEGYLKDELERTVSIAASIAVWAAGAGYAIGLLANGAFPEADRPIRLPPSSASDQVTRVLESLATVQPLTLSDLADVVHRERGRISAGSTIIAVASLVPESLAAALRRLSDEGHAVFVVATSERVDTSLLGEIPVRSLGGAFRPPEVPA